MKRCSKCKRELSLSAFSPSRGTKDGLCNYCKECVRAIKRYEGMTKAQIEKERERNHIYSNALIQAHRVYCQYDGLRCKVCGARMEVFHHAIPTTKIYAISGMVGFRRELVDVELEKCIPVCVSCHRKIHGKG